MPRHAGLRKRKYRLEGSEMRGCAHYSVANSAEVPSGGISMMSPEFA
jgi:hypothetical protein